MSIVSDLSSSSTGERATDQSFVRAGVVESSESDEVGEGVRFVGSRSRELGEYRGGLPLPGEFNPFGCWVTINGGCCWLWV